MLFNVDILDEYSQINRVTKVRQYLFTVTFFKWFWIYIWIGIEQCVHNFHAFLSALVQRVKDQYLQSWYAELADSSKLCLYKDYKLYYEHEELLKYHKYQNI